ncbi:MAG: hypothetical protein GH143_03540 [Calditrichaeota bacterium]|nr:hypothetical protein [Calditrichota bacterium]
MGTPPIPTYIALFMKFSLRLIALTAAAVILWYGCDGTGVEPTDELPVLSNPQTSYDDRDSRFYAAVTVTLPEDITALDSIWAEMYLATGDLADSLGMDSLWTQVTLNDSAVSGDILPQDGIYARKFDSPLPEGTGGSVRFEFYAFIVGDTSNTSNTSDTLRLANLRPVILSVSAADTLELPSEGDHKLDIVRATVTDPDGLADIKIVGFTSLKPDSTLANNGQLIVLVDNGDPIGWGDETPGDGIYSRITPLPSDALTGKYVYKFVAKDFSGAVSDTVTHTLVVVQ